MTTRILNIPPADTSELSEIELSCVSGGGLMDKLLQESEATTETFLKQFAESNRKVMNFVSSPGSQVAAPADG